MNEHNVLDSSIWIAYLFDGKFIEEIEHEDKLFLSVLSLFEIKKKLLTKKINGKDLDNKIDFIKKRNILLPIDGKIAEKASEISAEKSLPAIDSLIYATSLVNNLKLVSLDNDFRELENAEVLEIED
jgi:predicted nucleic acid-binding protein